MKPAVLYQPLADQRVKCLACSWYCHLNPDQVGVCATRLNRNGKLYSLVYGQTAGLHLDPVEKKPLFHFLPGKSLLSFGTLGCNFGCLFCQNWTTSQINKSAKNSPAKLTHLINQYSAKLTPKQIVAAALDAGAAGIAYTYNEPAIFAEFAHDTARLAKKSHLKNVYVSNGFESVETFAYLKDYLDAINIDLKSFSPEFYRQICKAKIGPVKQNIKRFFDSGIETEVTTLIIPGLNDSPAEFKRIAQFLVKISPDIPWHLSAFYPCYQMANVPPTPHTTLIKAYDLGLAAGLHYLYVGNLPDPVRSNTYCPNCHQLLINRSGFEAQIINLDMTTGRCRHCQTAIYGRWQ